MAGSGGEWIELLHVHGDVQPKKSPELHRTAARHAADHQPVHSHRVGLAVEGNPKIQLPHLRPRHDPFKARPAQHPVVQNLSRPAQPLHHQHQRHDEGDKARQRGNPVEHPSAKAIHRPLFYPLCRVGMAYSPKTARSRCHCRDGAQISVESARLKKIFSIPKTFQTHFSSAPIESANLGAHLPRI